MKWDEVLAKVAATVAEDTLLRSIYGQNMRMAGTGDHRVPLLEHMLIAEGGEDELWNPHTIQFDQFVQTMAAATASERRLRRLFHSELQITVGGLKLWSQYQDGDMLAVPKRDNYYGRAIRFRMTTLREKYEPISL